MNVMKRLRIRLLKCHFSDIESQLSCKLSIENYADPKLYFCVNVLKKKLLLAEVTT